MVIKWVAEKQLKSVTQYNIEKSSFDLNIEVRRGKSSCEIVGGRKTVDTIESSDLINLIKSLLKDFSRKDKFKKRLRRVRRLYRGDWGG